MNTIDFQTQLSSILDILTKTAIVEIGKLFEENSMLLRLQISGYTEQNEFLKKRCRFLESQLQSARKSTAGKMNETPPAQRVTLPSVSEPKPSSIAVFCKEWSINEESNSQEQDDCADLDSTGEPNSLLEEEPDVIIKEEMPKNDDCFISSSPENDASDHLRGPEMSRDGRLHSGGYTTYTVPSDEQTTEGLEVSAQDQATGLDHNILQIPRKKKHECLICGKNFEYLSLVQRHMRTHSAEKPYECPVCGKWFGQKRYLIAHERTHSGVKPYVCLECGKSFSMKRSLNLHLQMHTGVKPLKLHQVW